MRFGRILLSLAPLFGLTALVNAASADPQLSSQHPFIRLLQTVVQMTAPDAESISSTADSIRPSLHTVLSITALSSTPLGRSLWMLAPLAISIPFLRRPQRTLLRC